MCFLEGISHQPLCVLQHSRGVPTPTMRTTGLETTKGSTGVCYGYGVMVMTTDGTSWPDFMLLVK